MQASRSSGSMSPTPGWPSRPFRGLQAAPWQRQGDEPATAGTTRAAGIPKLPALSLRAARGHPSRPPGCSAALCPCGRASDGPLPDGRHRPRRARPGTRSKRHGQHRQLQAQRGRHHQRRDPHPQVQDPGPLRRGGGQGQRAEPGFPHLRPRQGRAGGSLEEGQREPGHLLLGVARRSFVHRPGLCGADPDRGRPRPVQPRLVPPAQPGRVMAEFGG